METSISEIQTAPDLAGLRSLSRPVSSWKVMAATTLKGLQISTRYLPNLVGSLVEMAVRAAFFLLMSNSISMGGKEAFGIDIRGQNLFIFFLGSLVLFIFTRSTLWGPINAVTNDLYNGTLEYLYSNPCSRYAYYVGTVLSEVAISQVVFIPLFALLAVYSGAGWGNLALMLTASIVVLVALTAMGIMIALLALVWRQVGSVASVLGILFEMLAGAYLPVSVFPLPLQWLAYLLPYTWGYDLIRYYSFEGQWKTILPVEWEWAVIIVFAVVFTLVSRYLLGKAEMLAKRSGLSVI